MNFDISDSEKISLHEAVGICPYCGKLITPLLCAYQTVFCEDYTSVQYAICKCPSIICNSIFFAKYEVEGIPINFDEIETSISNVEIFPFPVISTSLDSIFEEISPAFIKTYNEAESAYLNNLHLICGPGYRLAFELLVKDFACLLHPDKADEIKKDSSVSNVIANRIPDKPIFQELKDIAKRAWWLGCDFSHYDKKYTDFDIKDLRACIEITVAEISYYFKKENYLKEIIKPQ